MRELRVRLQKVAERVKRARDVDQCAGVGHGTELFAEFRDAAGVEGDAMTDPDEEGQGAIDDRVLEVDLREQLGVHFRSTTRSRSAADMSSFVFIRPRILLSARFLRFACRR